jgi:uncharacterized protein
MLGRSGPRTSPQAAPIIEVHVHAMDDSFPAVPCAQTNRGFWPDPSTKEAPIGWSQEECTPKLYPAVKGEYIKDLVAEMERLNVIAVAFGDSKSVQKWKNAWFPEPASVMQWRPEAHRAPGTAQGLTQDSFKVMGEFGLQYEGTVPPRFFSRSVFRAGAQNLEAQAN